MIWVKFTSPTNFTYNHYIGECDYTYERFAVRTEQEQAMYDTIRIRVKGFLVGANTLDLDNQIGRLQLAIRDGGSIQLLDNSTGSTRATRLSLTSANTLSGIRVNRKPSFPGMKGAAFVTNMPYDYEIEGDVPSDDDGGIGNIIVSWSETVKRTGGGPLYGVMEVVRGNPVRVLRREKTAYRATQSGTAIGLLAPPTKPLPLWPQWQTGSPDESETSPHRYGSIANYRNFPISWSYDFIATEQLFGSPNIQPGG